MPMNVGKMLMLDRMAKSENGSEYGGDARRRKIGYDRDYDTEKRRKRDERGRYMEGDGWEYNHNYPNERDYPESRRRRDGRGRYMMEGMDDDEEPEMRDRWYPPHMTGGSKYGFRDVYADVYAPNAMNRPMRGGSQHGDMSQPVDEHTARMWVEGMDGGEHYRIEQTEQHRKTICPDCDMWEYYVAMNAMYSDYCETARKIGKDAPEFYAHLAKDFLKDKDAKPHKLRRYMEYIAK